MKTKLLIKIIITVLITFFMTFMLLYSLLAVIFLGPSQYASKILVNSLMETSAAKFVPYMFFSDEEVENIIKRQAEATDVEIQGSLVNLPLAKPDITNPDETFNDEDESGIEIVDVKGSTYYGKMMIVKDPKRVFVGIPTGGYGYDKSGMLVSEMVEAYDAVGGTNAGGFYDPNGNGTGGVPDGIVIYEGELLWGDPDAYYSIAGIDSDGLLHVGKINAKTALERDMQYATTYGPALIINGSPQNESYMLGGGLNPRTAIGQRSDGAMLILVINGRSVDSLGATYDDLVEIFLKHDAVNATNLDGGSSSLMIYEGENITNSAYVYGERIVATSILVK